MPVTIALLLLVSVVASVPAGAQDIREHIRGTRPARPVTQSQAEDLSLTLGAVEPRLVQNWVRTAGRIDASGRALTATLSGPDAALVKVGQRVRAFPPSSKQSMYQARVTKTTPRGAAVDVEVSFVSPARENTSLYVIEIVVERGPFLSVPNEALIEEGDRHVVYVQRSPGQYLPQVIHTGIQGELYTQVLDGVKPGEQVVTFGSFFIDAEHKLKASDQGPSD